MNVIDLSGLAFFPETEELMVQYIANASGLFSSRPAHRYVVRSFQTDLSPAAGFAEVFNQSAWDAGTGDLSLNKMFIGNCSVLLQPHTAFSGIYTFSLQMDCPPFALTAGPTIYYDDSGLAQMQLNQCTVIKLPWMPFYGIRFTLDAGAGAAVNCKVTSFWSGIHFER